MESVVTVRLVINEVDALKWDLTDRAHSGRHHACSKPCRGALGLFLYTSKTHLKSKPCSHGRFTLRHNRGD